MEVKQLSETMLEQIRLFARRLLPLGREQATPLRTEKKGRGRPPGKRSDPDYAATTILLSKQLRAEVKGILLRPEFKGTDFSGLVEQCLCKWVGKQNDNYTKSPVTNPQRARETSSH